MGLSADMGMSSQHCRHCMDHTRFTQATLLAGITTYDI